MVRKHTSVALTLVVTGMFTVTAAAQTQAPAAAPAQAPAPPPLLKPNDLRHQIFVMEGALQRAVQYGAQQYNRLVRSMSQEMAMLAGDAQARGVYLEGYGVFFDVGVPIIRQSMMWSLQTMYRQDDENLRTIHAGLKAMLQETRGNIAQRRSLEEMIDRLELQIGINQRGGMPPQQVQPGVTGLQPGVTGAAILSPDNPPTAAPTPPRPTSSPQERQLLQDPNRVYTEAVQRAIIEAMIDYAQPMLLGADEWLTVGARDNEPRDSFAPQDPFEEVVTVLLRIKGSDLAAYRAGRIDREEAMKRVQIKEF